MTIRQVFDRTVQYLTSYSIKYVYLDFLMLMFGKIYKFRNRLRQQNYDPINFETLNNYSNWVLEESPRFLTIEEVESLRNDLANMTTQPVLYNTGMFLLQSHYNSFCQICYHYMSIAKLYLQ